MPARNLIANKGQQLNREYEPIALAYLRLRLRKFTKLIMFWLIVMIATWFFCLTFWLMIMHHYAKFGYKRPSSSEVILLTKDSTWKVKQLSEHRHVKQ